MQVDRRLFTKLFFALLQSCGFECDDFCAGGFSQNCLRGRNHATESFWSMRAIAIVTGGIAGQRACYFAQGGGRHAVDIIGGQIYWKYFALHAYS